VGRPSLLGESEIFRGQHVAVEPQPEPHQVLPF
jgi:hypothetical protein